MALCVAHFFPAHTLLFLLCGGYKCVDCSIVSSCSPGFQVGMRDLAAWGRALVSEQLLCQVKLRELLVVVCPVVCFCS